MKTIAQDQNNQNTFQYERSNYQNETLELNRVMGAIKRRKYFIAALVVLCTFIASITMHYVPSTYRTEAKVIVEGDRENIVNIDQVVEDFHPDTYTNHTEAAVIESRFLSKAVIERLNLLQHPLFADILKAKEPSLFQRIKAFISGTNISENTKPRISKNEATERAINRYLRNLQVIPSNQSRVITIRYSSTDPKLAADIVNTVSQEYINQQLSQKDITTTKAEKWLTHRADELREKVVSAENKLETFRKKEDIVDIKGASIYSEQLAHLTIQLINAKNQRKEKETRYKQVQELLDSPNGMESLPTVLESPLILKLREDKIELQRQLSEYRTKYRGAHPEMRSLQAEIRNISLEISKEAAKIINNLKSELEVNVAREKSLFDDIVFLKSKLGSEAEAEVSLRTYESEVDANKQLYETILSRLKETNVQDENLQSPDARIISYAMVPQHPVQPNRKAIVIAVFIMSSILAIGLTLLIEFTMQGFHNIIQVETELGIPAFAMVPQVQGKKLKPLFHYLLKPDATPLYGEAVRGLRSTLFNYMQGQNGKVLLLTSTTPEEGKSSTALSLAMLSSMVNQKCLIIDCDLRRSKVARQLGVNPTLKLLHFLAGKASFEEVVNTDSRTGIDYIIAGRSRLHPLDLLSSRRMLNLISEAKKQYDLIILDTPPLSSVSDALLLAPYADLSLYLIRWEKTRRNAAAHCIKTLQERTDKPVGAVLTRVDIQKHSLYQYSDSDYTQYAAYSM